MKKICFFLLFTLLLGLCGCGPHIPPEPQEIEYFNQATTATLDGRPPQPAYDISEFDPALGPGPFSVDELAGRFGELTDLSVAPQNGWTLLLYAAFKGIQFQFYYDEPLEDWSSYTPTEEDRARPLYVQSYMVEADGDLPLPRGIRIGDSLESVRAAYPAPPYRGQIFDDGSASLFYHYGGTNPLEYGVTYNFSANRLDSVRFEWSNAAACRF